MLKVAQCSVLDFELTSLLGGPGSQVDPKIGEIETRIPSYDMSILLHVIIYIYVIYIYDIYIYDIYVWYIYMIYIYIYDIYIYIWYIYICLMLSNIYCIYNMIWYYVMHVNIFIFKMHDDCRCIQDVPVISTRFQRFSRCRKCPNMAILLGKWWDILIDHGIRSILYILLYLGIKPRSCFIMFYPIINYYI